MNKFQAHPADEEPTVDESIAAALRSPYMWVAALVIVILAFAVLNLVLVPS